MRRRAWIASAFGLLASVRTARSWSALGTSDSAVELVIGRWWPSEPGAAKQGDGKSPLNAPFGIDFEPDGSMIVVELEGGRVHRLDTSNRLTTIAGDGSTGYSGDGGPARSAIFNGMHNVAVTRNGSILIADTWNHAVRVIEPEAGTITTFAGTGKPGYSGDGGPASQSQFHDIICVSLNPPESALLITDIQNRRVRSVDLESRIVTTLAGNGSKGVPKDGAAAKDSPLVDPRAAAADAEGRVYVLERGGHALRAIEPDGTIRTVVGNGEPGQSDGPGLEARLNSPKHLCVDARGRVFMADDENAAIRMYDPATRMVSTILGRGPIQLSHPHGVCVQGDRLYVVDTRHDRILRMPLPA
jgi:sugar lactone lactonase YvrE